MAGPGRFLWVAVRLRGTRHASPRVRSLRVESPGHDLLRRLPRAFSRDEADASFLRRYLAVFDGLVHELESRAASRDVLLDPRGTPPDMLPWLAGFLGLALDDRWPEPARRTLVAEAAWLFRFRGTVPGLERFLEIYLGEPVVVLEHFRLRGMGGALLGERGPGASRAVVGAGFRVGGTVGEPGESPLAGSARDAFRTHAHRFSVLVRGSLTGEQLDVVRHVLDVHRPAHTVVEVCPLGAGMRVGRRLHLGISSAIGPTGGAGDGGGGRRLPGARAALPVLGPLPRRPRHPRPGRARPGGARLRRAGPRPRPAHARRGPADRCRSRRSRHPGAAPGSEVFRACARETGPDRRAATVEADPGWIDVRLRLDEVSTDVRRAGLDLDPGWLPWLGAVVRFVYA